MAPNKFLAKIASDWRKPDGLFVIPAEEVDQFLAPLPVGRIPGVGKVTERRLLNLGVRSVAELRTLDESLLTSHFGSYGRRLYLLARGVDESAVIPKRPRRSISAEDTFEDDVLLSGTEPMIRKLSEKVWSALRKELHIARTVVLKLKTSDFKIYTRSVTPEQPVSSCEELSFTALRLRNHTNFDPPQRFRLIGVGLSNFRDFSPAEQQELLFRIPETRPHPVDPREEG